MKHESNRSDEFEAATVRRLRKAGVKNAKRVAKEICEPYVDPPDPATEPLTLLLILGEPDE